MANLNYHPAAGFGDLPPGWTVPMGPVYDEGGPLKPSISAAMGRPVRLPRVREILPTGMIRPYNPVVGALKRSSIQGFGDFVGASYVTPQNPILDGMSGMGDFVPAMFVTPQNPIDFQANGMGDFSPASFVTPQNPISSGMGCMGCGGAYGSNPSGLQGMGAVSDWVPPIFLSPSPLGTSIPNWMFYGGIAAVGYYFLFMHKGHRGGGGHSGTATALNPRRRHKRRRNESVEQGFWRGGVFHPIRASSDYDPEAVGESRQYARTKAKKRRKR